MKIGDKVPVNIGSHVVAQATVKELGDGTATLIVPATLVVMGTRTELSDLPEQEKSTEVILDAPERPAEAPDDTEQPEPVVVEAPPEPVEETNEPQ